MARRFDNIAQVIKDVRVGSGYSQTEMSDALGYKNGQFISNVERGLCSIPAKAIPAIVKTFDVSSGVIISAMVADYRASLESFVPLGHLGV